MNSIFSVITKILSLVIIFIVIYVTLAVLLLMGFISMQLSITAIIAALIPAFLIYLICAVLISNSNHLGSPVPIKIGRTLLYAVLSGMLGFLILSGDYVRNRIDRVFVHRYYAQAEDIIS